METSEYLSSKLKFQKNGKQYFSLKEICEDLNYDFNSTFENVGSVLEKFKAMGFYSSTFMAIRKNTFKEIGDIIMSPEALMFVSADIGKTSQNATWKEIAKEIYSTGEKSYAEKRYFSRKNYSMLSSKLNKILGSMLYVQQRGLDVCLQEVYSTIIINYFRVHSKAELYKKKNLTEGQNYLDYISKAELDNLSWVIESLCQYASQRTFYSDVVSMAEVYARECSKNFIKTFKCTPAERPAHFHKPKTMLKNYFKLLNFYDLAKISEESVDNYNNSKIN